MSDKTLSFSDTLIRELVGKYPTPFYLYDEAGIRIGEVEKTLYIVKSL